MIVKNTTPVAIDVNNVKKKFKIYYDRGLTLKEKLLFQKRRRYEEHWVLKGISFQVRKGEAVGLIGENGCGKSTTLKMLTKILYPDEGTIVMNGRVSSLIELGAGFHPDMTGRENIYTNASIFGLKQDEIEHRLQEIIDFSEMGPFIDNPVRTYSSGMYMRLAFAVAINVDADILLIDEILAVGDISYQTKCFNKLREIKAKGTTIVIVSHSLEQIESICDRSYWINDGIIMASGIPHDVHLEYKQYMLEKSMNKLDSQHEKSEDNNNLSEMDENDRESSDENEELKKDPNHSSRTGWQLSVASEDTPGQPRHFGTGKALIQNVVMCDSKGKKTNVFMTGQDLQIHYNYHFIEKAKEPCCGITIHRMDGVHCYGVNSQLDHMKWEPRKEGQIQIDIKQLPLLSGEYMLDVAIAEKGDFDCDYFKNAQRFTVLPNSEEVGLVSIQHKWTVIDKA